MPRNKLIDLTNHLFEVIEKLKDGDIELSDARCICDVAKNIIEIKKVEVMQANVLISAGMSADVGRLMAISEEKDSVLKGN